MRREEALLKIQSAKFYTTVLNPIWDEKEIGEARHAFDMAIEALFAEKTGKWIRITRDGYVPQEFMCSVCGRTIRYDGILPLLIEHYPYCHCGARMEADND